MLIANETFSNNFVLFLVFCTHLRSFATTHIVKPNPMLSGNFLALREALSAMSKKPQEMSKFCETSRQLCLLLLIVVVRGGCNTQSHSMSNNNNEYEWVSWLHVTFGNANIQPAKQGRTETKKRRWKSLSKIRILLSYVKKKGARCRKRNAFFFTSLQSTPPTRVYP